MTKEIEIKAKINKWDLIKLNKLLFSRGNHQEKEMVQEKVFANDATDMGLISKIYKQFIQQNRSTTKTNNSMEKWAK